MYVGSYVKYSTSPLVSDSTGSFNETREYVRRISARYGSISNPAMASTATRVTSKTATKLAKVETPPLTVQQNAMAIKLLLKRLEGIS